MKTVLQIVQQMCRATGIPVPAALVSNTDSQIIQMLALLNEGLDEMVPRFKWPQLQATATFTSLAAENQGELATIAPGFKSLIPDTFWSTTNSLPAQGSITPQEAGYLKTWGRPSALVQFREVNNQLHIVPAPAAAGDNFRFEYNSRNAVITATTLATKESFTADSDTCKLPDFLLQMDLRWRWKKEKGLPYAEEFRTFEANIKQSFVDSGAARKLSLGGGNRCAAPGIIVPIGSWGA